MVQEKLLTVNKLRTEFFQNKKTSVTAINEISFDIGKGEILGLVGESGCGKSVTSLSIMRLLNFTSGKVTKGEVIFDGKDLQKLSEKEMREIRGGKMSMIFQEPMSSLNPAMRIDKQMIEGIRLHTNLSKQEARERAAKILQQVGIPDPERVLKNYPHQLSGGMSQRVMIAMAMSCNPQLLIADEPTTALDVTIQAQILELMKKIQQEEGMSILLITHDLGVVAEMCTRVIVMYAGEIVEEAPVEVLFNNPTHPYTEGLIASVPKLGSGVKVLPSIPGSVPDLSMLPKGCRFAPRCKYATERCHNEEPDLFEVSEHQKCRCWLRDPHAGRKGGEIRMGTIVSVKNVSKIFPVGKNLFGKPDKFVHAVNDVSFDIQEGETFSVVGESGCGKSTTGRLIDHLLIPDSGEIWFEGKDISKLSENEMRPLRKDIQMIFQDPAGSLNPRMRVEDLVEEPLLIHTNLSKEERMKIVHELLETVGLSAKHAKRYPHEFSGGQKQRIGIARALTVRPKLIIADEPISALDVSIQAQVLNLLHELQQKFNLTYMFISHDLSVVEMISDRIAVMYLGFVVETAPKEMLYKNPSHPYTQALLSAVPIPDPGHQKERIILEGDIPSTINLPKGCPFAARCKMCKPECLETRPTPKEIEPGHIVSCHLFK
jgi:peptide/nickel transport system ATP-binding protein